MLNSLVLKIYKIQTELNQSIIQTELNETGLVYSRAENAKSMPLLLVRVLSQISIAKISSISSNFSKYGWSLANLVRNSLPRQCLSVVSIHISGMILL